MGQRLNTLNITALKARVPQTPQEGRRFKLVTKLEEQLAMASAAAEGRPFSAMKSVWRKEADGNRVRVDREKRVKAWWWQDGGAVSMVVRYGAKPVELAKGKRAISVPNLTELPAVICTVIAAVQDGELDAAIDAVVSASKAKPGSKA